MFQQRRWHLGTSWCFTSNISRSYDDLLAETGIFPWSLGLRTREEELAPGILTVTGRAPCCLLMDGAGNTVWNTVISDLQEQCNFDIIGAFSPLGEVGCCTPSLGWRQPTRVQVSGWRAPGRLLGPETTSSDKLEWVVQSFSTRLCLTFPFQRRAAAPSAHFFYAFLTWNTF